MIESVCTGYHDVTFTICHSDGTCTTQSGPICVTIHCEDDISERLNAANEKLDELADELYDKAKECADRCDVNRPAPRPVMIFHPKGSRRPTPTQLESTYG